MSFQILLSDAEREYILQGANNNIRNDGRSREDFRLAEIEFNVIPQASGSARVRLGGTDVIVGVKAEIGNPEEDKPDAGRLQFSVECSPLATPAFRGRGGDELASELTKALERSMFTGMSRTNNGFPLRLDTLSIVSGKTCWVLYVDALLMDLDGNALDVLSIAIKAALAHTRVPKVEVAASEIEGEEAEYEIDDDPEQATRLDVSNVPLILTVCQVGKRCILDPTSEEYSCADAVLQVAVDAQGAVCGVAKRRTKGIDTAMLLEMLAVAQRKAPQLHTSIDTFVNDRLKAGD